MKIAICDDDYGVCSDVEKWILKYSKLEAVRTDIYVFHSPDELILEMKQGGWFDAFFLDIEFDESNGIELDEYIRKNAGYDTCGIIFFSGNTSYCQSLFDMEPMNFHRKPLRENMIFRDLNKLIRRYGAGRKFLRCVDDGRTYDVYLSDICYIERINKKSYIHKKDGEVQTVTEKLSELEQQLEDETNYMLRCHRSYTVNLHYIVRYNRQKLYFKDGTMVPVGRKYQEAVKTAWIKYDLEID